MQPRPLLHGIREGMAHEDYLAVQAASKSLLWTLHTKSPLHAIADHEQTSFMQFGSAAHCAVLEPQHFESRFARGPDDRRGNKWKEAQAELPIGSELLTSGDYDAVRRLRDNAASHRTLRELLKGARIEVSAFCEIGGLQCKARPDAVSGDVLVDLKTTTDASPRAFAATCRRFGYHVQEAWYRDVWETVSAERNILAPSVRRFIFVAVESKPPYAIAIYELDAADVVRGHAIANAALLQYSACVESKNWPGYYEGVQPLSLDGPRLSMGGEEE